MPSNTQQADRRVEQYRKELESLRGPGSRAAQALNDVSLLRGTMERLLEVLSPGKGIDAISIAVQVGAAREVLQEFKQAQEEVRKKSEGDRKAAEKAAELKPSEPGKGGQLPQAA